MVFLVEHFEEQNADYKNNPEDKELIHKKKKNPFYSSSFFCPVMQIYVDELTTKLYFWMPAMIFKQTLQNIAVIMTCQTLGFMMHVSESQLLIY